MPYPFAGADLKSSSSQIKNLACTTKLAVSYLEMFLPLPVTLRMHVLKYCDFHRQKIF